MKSTKQLLLRHIYLTVSVWFSDTFSVFSAGFLWFLRVSLDVSLIIRYFSACFLEVSPKNVFFSTFSWLFPRLFPICFSDSFFGFSVISLRLIKFLWSFLLIFFDFFPQVPQALYLCFSDCFPRFPWLFHQVTQVLSLGFPDCLPQAPQVFFSGFTLLLLTVSVFPSDSFSRISLTVSLRFLWFFL